MPYPVADTITFLFQVFPLLLSHIRNWFDIAFLASLAAPQNSRNL
jgi:hypothetical protein